MTCETRNNPSGLPHYKDALDAAVPPLSYSCEHMCGRYGVYADGSHVRERFGLAELPGVYEPRYNVAPTQPVLVVGIDAEGHRAARMMRWGFVPSWAASKEEAWHRAIINARAETVAQ